MRTDRSAPSAPAPVPAGTQWHPEKPPYEFGLDEVPHSIEAVMVSQHLGSVFIEAAKRCVVRGGRAACWRLLCCTCCHRLGACCGRGCCGTDSGSGQRHRRVLLLAMPLPAAAAAAVVVQLDEAQHWMGRGQARVFSCAAHGWLLGGRLVVPCCT